MPESLGMKYDGWISFVVGLFEGKRIGEEKEGEEGNRRERMRMEKGVRVRKKKRREESIFSFFLLSCSLLSSLKKNE